MNLNNAASPSPKPLAPPGQPPNPGDIQLGADAPVPVHAALPKAASPKLVLSCPVCDSDNVQRVAVIYEAGTQISTSRGVTAGRSAGLGYASGIGLMPVVGVTSSKTQTNHFSQTSLAYRLQPPSPPAHPPAPPQPHPPLLKTSSSEVATGMVATMLWALWAVPGGFIYSLGYRPRVNFGGFLFLLSVGPFLVCLAFFLWSFLRDWLDELAAQRQFRSELAAYYVQASQLTENWKEREAAWRAGCAASDARWSEQNANWKRLFYCLRCDHVFLPETGAAAPASQMDSIL